MSSSNPSLADTKKQVLDSYIKWNWERNKQHILEESLMIYYHNLIFGTKRKETTMSFDKAKPYSTVNTYYGGSESFATQAEAEKAAKTYAAKNMIDVPVYKAVSLVNAPLPSNFVIDQLS